MDQELHAAIAKIELVDHEGRPVRGTGFVVTDSLVLTALHVVAARSSDPPRFYAGPFLLSFPSVVTEAVVEGRWDRDADWALLRCKETPQVRPIPLRDLQTSLLPFRSFGFPDAQPIDGMWIHGEVVAVHAPLYRTSVIQLFSHQAAAANGMPANGLSGAPVLIEGAAVGLLRYALGEKRVEAGTVYACPARSVVQACGDVLELVSVESIPRPLAEEAPSRSRGSNRIPGPLPVKLVGRGTVLASLYDAVAGRGQRVLSLIGEPGSGKSALARTIALACRDRKEPWGDRFEVVVWTSAQSTWLSPSGIRTLPVRVQSGLDIYREVFRAVGRPGLATVPVDRQTEALLELLDQRRTLVIMDNIESLVIDDYLAQVLREVPAGSALLATSSVELDIVRAFPPLKIDSLDRHAALELLGELRRHLGKSSDDDADAQLYDAIGGLPLALEWAIAQLDGDDVQGILEGIRSHHGDVCRFLFEDRVKPRLQRNDWIVLATLAFFPSPPDRDGILAVSGAESARLQEALRLLKSHFLVYEEASGRWDIHRLTRSYVLPQLKSDQATEGMRERFIRWAVGLARANEKWEFDADQYAKVSDEIANLKAALDLGMSRSLIDTVDLHALAVAVAHMLHIHGRWEEAAEMLQKMLGVAPSGPLSIDARILLGRHHAHRREVREALDVLALAMAEARRIGDLGREAEAMMRCGHALTHQDLEAARGVLQRARDLAAQAGRWRTQVSVIGYLADVLIQLGQFPQAIDLLEGSSFSGEGVRWERANAYFACLRGDANLRAGNIEDARKAYTEATNLFKTWPDERLRAWTLIGLAECDARRDLAEEALRVFAMTGMQRERARAQAVIDRLVRKARRTLRVFVLGPPAAGKTTVRSLVSRWLSEKGHPVAILGIEEMHRELLPQGQEDGTYRYDASGALELLEADRQVAAALALLVQRCRQAAGSTGFVVEFTHRNYVHALNAFDSDVLTGAIVLYVSAPLLKRRERNAARGSGRVPERIVEEYPEDLGPDVGQLFIAKGATLELIDAGGSREELERRVEEALARVVDFGADKEGPDANRVG